MSVGDGALRNPRHWWLLRDPFTPSWGEPYLEIAQRMLAAVHRARELAAGHEALCVSHQLPIWTLRRYVSGQQLWHDPRRRQCALASLTSLVFDDGELVQLRYTEPAGRSDPDRRPAHDTSVFRGLLRCSSPRSCWRRAAPARTRWRPAGLHLRRPRRADHDRLRPAGEPRHAAAAVAGRAC